MGYCTPFPSFLLNSVAVAPRIDDARAAASTFQPLLPQRLVRWPQIRGRHSPQMDIGSGWLRWRLGLQGRGSPSLDVRLADCTLGLTTPLELKTTQEYGLCSSFCQRHIALSSNGPLFATSGQHRSSITTRTLNHQSESIQRGDSALVGTRSITSVAELLGN